MIIATRIVLTLVALLVLAATQACTFCITLFGGCFHNSSVFSLSCLFKFTAITIGIPLAIASVVWFFRKSKAIFWNTLVGALVVMAASIYLIDNYTMFVVDRF